MLRSSPTPGCAARLGVARRTASATAARPPLSRARRARATPRAEASAEDDKFSFGYTRQDALLICVAVPAAGFALQAALLAAGADSLTAGNTVLVVLVGGLSLVWAATYVQRVVNKDMTYAKQLASYEEAVMAKRLEELPEAELEQMMKEVEAEKARTRVLGPRGERPK